MRNSFRLIWLTLISLCLINSSYAKIQDEKKFAIEKTKAFINEIATKSYPEIKLKKLRVKTFESDTNFFKARFSITRFLTFQKMRHLVYVNPKVFSLNASEDGIRAIIAHELAHVLYYTEKNRFQLLGLANLASGSFTTKFERKADLEAIKRGYGKGLIEYREWLYKNIPDNELKSKKKNYFTPEEIKIITEVRNKDPEMLEVWRENIPLNIYEIKKSIE